MSAKFADDLRRWNRECSGWEPSQSLLQRGADDAADVIDALYDALLALVKAVNTNELAAAMACHEIVAFSNVEDALKLALPAIRKARGEQ